MLQLFCIGTMSFLHCAGMACGAALELHVGPGGNDAFSDKLAEPQFVDPKKDDYRLKPGSPAFKLGFEQIPVEKIGPYRDELRATRPIVEAPGARERPVEPGGER